MHTATRQKRIQTSREKQNIREIPTGMPATAKQKRRAKEGRNLVIRGSCALTAGLRPPKDTYGKIIGQMPGAPPMCLRIETCGHDGGGPEQTGATYSYVFANGDTLGTMKVHQMRHVLGIETFSRADRRDI